MKFRLIKDLVVNTGFEDVKLYNKGDIITPDENGNYIFIGLEGKVITQTKEYLQNKSTLFEEFIEIELNVEELDMDADEIIKRYRIQLDVKTSLKNLKKIELFLKEHINELL